TSNVSPDNYYKSFYWKKYIEPQFKNQLSPFTAKNNDSILTVLGRWAWGPCLGIAARGNYAYIGNGNVLQVLDMSNPSTPVIKGEYLAEEQIQDIQLKDTLAFVCILRGLLIFSITDAEHPTVVGYVALPGVASVAVVDSFAYVTNGTGSLYIVYIANPAQPLRVGIAFPGIHDDNIITASGRRVYAPNSSDPMIRILNVTNPQNILYSYFGPNGWPFGLYASDSILFAGISLKLRLFSIANPDTPSIISELNLGTIIHYLVRVDSLVYCATRDSGIIIVDISDIQLPKKRGVFKPTLPPITARYVFPKIITVSGNNVYVAYRNGALGLKAETPDSLHLLSFFKTGGGTNKLFLKDSYVFAAQGAAGLWILDISNPEIPHQISNVSIGGDIVDVIVEDSLMYVLGYSPSAYLKEDTTQGIWIVNISNPALPRILSHHYGISKYVSKASPIKFAKSGKKIIVLHRQSGGYTPGDSLLEVVDVSNPLAPTSVSVFEKYFEGYSIAANDSIIFVATDDKGLMVINGITVPPQQITSVFPYFFVRSVAIRDSFIFTSKQDSLYILNITNPYYPQRVGSVYTNANGSDMSISQNFVYRTDGHLRVIDISNPVHPVVKTEIDEVSTVSAMNDLLAFNSYEQGICIARNNLITSVANEYINTLATDFHLEQNYPNPFNPITTIRFTIYEPRITTLKVFNILGEKIATLLNNEPMQTGKHEIQFDASKLTGGVYFYRLSNTKEFITKKMVVIK
ncbi:MAG: T9SS type A sorting domain-containing protein, partial [Bacteroidota bacterium]